MVSFCNEKNNFSYEILFIDDGSTDDSWQIIENLSQANSNVKGIRFKRIMVSRKPYMQVLPEHKAM